MAHPINSFSYLFRAGGLAGSVFSLIAATLGSGTISFAYAVMMNGYLLGPLLIIMGACLSYYTGLLIVRCAEHTGRERYEDIALAMFGTKVSKFTSFLNLACLMGFTFAYIVYVKDAIP
jgi:amino acid permease